MAECLEPVYLRVGEGLRFKRLSANISQAKMAEVLNVPTNTYRNYETAKNRIPLHTLIEIAQYFKVSVNYFMDYGQESEPVMDRIVLELKKGADIEKLENLLYKKTRLEDTFGVNMLAIADGRPEVMGLKSIIKYSVDFQYEIATRKYQTLLHSRKIAESTSTALGLTGSDMDGAGNQIGRALREINSVSSYDEKLDMLAGQLSEIDNLLSDFHRELLDYIEEIDVGEAAFSEIEARLNLVNHLKAKYGKSIEKVLEYADLREEKLEKLLDYEQYFERLKRNVNTLEERCMQQAKELSDIRKAASAELSHKLRNALLDLNFLHVEMEISVKQGEELTLSGLDFVEFLISTNPGQALKPLKEVASGGELSRIMLGLKTVLKKDTVDTLIFDEIDAGISGKTAWLVSEKLGLLSKERQIICITHLPQIAAKADNHFLIEKSVRNAMTKTTIQELSMEERIAELARMLGGEETTQAALDNAKALLEQAESGGVKNKI